MSLQVDIVRSRYRRCLRLRVLGTGGVARLPPAWWLSRMVRAVAPGGSCQPRPPAMRAASPSTPDSPGGTAAGGPESWDQRGLGDGLPAKSSEPIIGRPRRHAAAPRSPRSRVRATELDENELRALATADHVIVHVDNDGRRYAAACMRAAPDQVEAIAQRLAALILRMG